MLKSINMSDPECKDIVNNKYNYLTGFDTPPD